jgi:hypothetical protein
MSFSAERAIGAGFRLIRREPLAFLAWTVVYLVIGILPVFAMFSVIVPVVSRFAQAAAESGANGAPMSPAEAFRLQATMMQVQPLVWLGSIVSRTLVAGAVFRAVLYPEDRRFLYLRLSQRELWLGLVMLVLIVLLFMGLFAVMFPTAIFAGVASALTHDAAAAAPFVVIVACAAMAVLIWGALRLSLAGAMSFALPGFRLFESWTLTRGHAGKMFLIALALFVIAWIAEMILVVAGFAAVAGTVGLQAVGDWFQHPHPFDVAALTPWLVVAAVVGALLTTALSTLFVAAWAEIYRELEAGAERPVGVAR